ncbi:hypothetical protein NDA14_002409 [Ustilago hordei]|nr:hypothetical protein NDA14_002409 [Ustilago hordei]UTT90681.1 hypothetical protein NDA17_006719 [Ustilago hordei]
MLGRSRSSLTASSSVGTTLLAGQHFIPLLTFGLYSMFPCLISRFTYVCAVASSFSLLIASFANSVALLILFQGILLALIFAGSAIGGILWPIIFTHLLERIWFRWTLRTGALIQLIVLIYRFEEAFTYPNASDIVCLCLSSSA